MKRFISFLSIVLCSLLLASVVVFPSERLIANAFSSTVTLTSEDFTLVRVNNCTVEGNMVSSTSNQYPQFRIQWEEPYRIENIRITATVCEEFSYLQGTTACISVNSVDSQSIGRFTGSISAGSTKTLSLTIDQTFQTKEVNRISCNGYWNKKPEVGAAWIRIDSIEIDVSEFIDAPAIIIDEIAETSAKVSWTPEEETAYSLWYSEDEITSDNIATIAKEKAAEGEITGATLDNLKNRTPYYLALEAVRDGKKGYSFAVVVPQAPEDKTIVLTTKDFTIEKINNCSVSKNTVFSTTNRYPQFNIALKNRYYIKSIAITAACGKTYNYVSASSAGIRLVTTDSQNAGTVTGTWNAGKTQIVSAELLNAMQELEVASMVCSGYWSKAPASASAASLKFIKIEIVGEKRIEPPELTFSDIKESSVRINWDLPKDALAELYVSEGELTDENLESAEKTLVDSGEISTALAEGLTTNQEYFFALKTLYGIQTRYSYGAVTPYRSKTVYDFEKSLQTSDYTVKTRNDSTSFYYINGGYGVKASISEENEYTDSGNALKLSFGEYKDARRNPIVFLYAPNWADYSGESFSMTLAKTRNQEGTDVSANCRLELNVDGKGIYQYKKGAKGILWPKDTVKQTLQFDYQDFTLRDDDTNILTPELSQHITAIRLFFDVPPSAGQFDLYVDSVTVYKVIPIVRQVENIIFQQETVTLQEGGTVLQSVVYEPYNATENDFIYISDTPEVATVDAESGLVTAMQQGIARIFVTAPSGVTKSYKVVVKEDSRGMQYRDLFTFDDGQISKNVTLSNCTPQLEYVKADEQVSLCLKSKGKMSATFTVDDYALYGEGIGIWTCGGGGRYVDIDLITKSGKTFSYSMMTDREDGSYLTLNYSVFKLNGKGPAPDRQDIIDLKKIRIRYDGTIYVDSIKVKDPLLFNTKTYPKNTVTDESVSISGDIKPNNIFYYLSSLKNGADYEWAKEALVDCHIIDSDAQPMVYSLDFVNKNYVEVDVAKPITLTIKIPYELAGLNNLWVLYIGDGEISGVTAHIVGDNISFETAKSGIYALVEGTDDSYLTKRIKTITMNEVLVSEGTSPRMSTRTVETIRRKKASTKDTQAGWGDYLWVLWIVIPAAVLVIAGGAVSVVLLSKKRKKKKAGDLL